MPDYEVLYSSVLMLLVCTCGSFFDQDAEVQELAWSYPEFGRPQGAMLHSKARTAVAEDTGPHSNWMDENSLNPQRWVDVEDPNALDKCALQSYQWLGL